MITSPFDSLQSALTLNPRDMSLDARDAWAYGIVLGWDEHSLRDLSRIHGWDAETVERLKALHSAFNDARDMYFQEFELA